MQHTKGNEVHFNGKLSRRRRKFWTLKEVNEREKHFPNLISGESRMSFDVCCVKLKPFCVLSHLNSCDVILEKMLMRGLEVGCNFIVFKGHMWCSEWWMFYDYVIIMSQLFPWTIIQCDVTCRSVQNGTNLGNKLSSSVNRVQRFKYPRMS